MQNFWTATQFIGLPLYSLVISNLHNASSIVYFFDGIDGDDVRLNLTPCASVNADMCIAKAQ